MQAIRDICREASERYPESVDKAVTAAMSKIKRRGEPPSETESQCATQYNGAIWILIPIGMLPHQPKGTQPMTRKAFIPSAVAEYAAACVKAANKAAREASKPPKPPTCVWCGKVASRQLERLSDATSTPACAECGRSAVRQKSYRRLDHVVK